MLKAKKQLETDRFLEFERLYREEMENQGVNFMGPPGHKREKPEDNKHDSSTDYDMYDLTEQEIAALKSVKKHK